ncbi:hypothetical protein NKR23_g394 [Pleurostoma richardsiae]|uniref:Uncharacterized protein n=1 Tax=Pleurostoma richardsiae TaxID=41990 RepID=A0AA38S7P4_9PEZI|nr:hypothetical protein NKR23_g394 [Pleurostoma richardsiae]
MAASNSSTSTCNSFEGNPDFYGLGIRIGIYLQWFASWIGIFVEPGSAQSMNDNNSIFVFAIIIATIAGTAVKAMKPVEVHIMLQFAFGYFLTVLSMVGLRFHLMTPARLAGFCDRWDQSDTQINVFPQYQEIFMFLEFFRPLKPEYLSWFGVVWRIIIANIVTAFNVYFWFTGLKKLSASETCSFVFMFSQQELAGRLVVFFKAMAIIITVFFSYITICFFYVAFVVALFLLFCIYRDLLHFFFRDRVQRSAMEFEVMFEKLRRIADQVTSAKIGSLVNTGPPAVISTILTLGYWAKFWTKIPAEEDIRTKDVLKICAVLASADVSIETERPESPQPSWGQKIMSCLLNVWTVGTMIWFIISIELTIRWNNIQGVNDINTTGQLIPFVIGCTTTAQVAKNVVIAVIKKAYPEWAKTKVIIKDTMGYPDAIIQRPSPEEQNTGWEDHASTSRLKRLAKVDD